jgi:hypothetical protein
MAADRENMQMHDHSAQKCDVQPLLPAPETPVKDVAPITRSSGRGKECQAHAGGKLATIIMLVIQSFYYPDKGDTSVERE